MLLGRRQFLGFRVHTHGAELGAAHGAERRVFKALLRERLIMHHFCSFGIERQPKLLAPVETIPGAGQGGVAGLITTPASLPSSLMST